MGFYTCENQLWISDYISAVKGDSTPVPVLQSGNLPTWQQVPFQMIFLSATSDMTVAFSQRS